MPKTNLDYGIPIRTTNKEELLYDYANGGLTLRTRGSADGGRGRFDDDDDDLWGW